MLIKLYHSTCMAYGISILSKTSADGPLSLTCSHSQGGRLLSSFISIIYTQNYMFRIKKLIQNTVVIHLQKTY